MSEEKLCVGIVDYGDGLFSFSGLIICAKKLISMRVKQWPNNGEGNKILISDYGDYYIESTTTYSAGEAIDAKWKRIYKNSAPAANDSLEQYVLTNLGDGLFTFGECPVVMKELVALEVNEYEAKADYGNWVLVVKADGDKNELRHISWERVYKEGHKPPDISEVIIEDLGDGLVSFGGSILVKNVQSLKVSYYEAKADCGDYFFTVTVEGEGNEIHNIKWKRVYKAEAGGNNG